MSFSKIFITKKNAKRLAKNVDYPTEEDAEIFDILKSPTMKRLKDFLLMPIYPPQIMEQIQLTSYRDLFSHAKNSYDGMNN